METYTSNVIPVIQACAEHNERTLFERVRNYFFSRSSTVKPLSNDELAARNYLFSKSNTATSQPSPVVLTTNTVKFTVVNNAVPAASNPVTFLNRVVNNADHTKNVIAREEVAALSKPDAVVTSKERILKLLTEVGDWGATIAELRRQLPDIAPKGLSSRVSELVKAEKVESVKNIDYEDKPVTVYFIRES